MSTECTNIPKFPLGECKKPVRKLKELKLYKNGSLSIEYSDFTAGGRVELIRFIYSTAKIRLKGRPGTLSVFGKNPILLSFCKEWKIPFELYNQQKC